jgi:surfeit locus 1 family protein
MRAPGDPTSSGHSLLVPALLTVGAFAILIGLGAWQLERKAWKDGLIETLTQRLAEPPQHLPRRERWSQLDPIRIEFRHVSFQGEFLHEQEALVYTTGSTLRNDRPTGPGYWVLTPARLPDGGLVVVNRGFVPEGRQDAKNRREGQVTGPVEIVGAVRWPEERNLFTPDDQPLKNLWFVRDHLAIASAKGWGDVAPFYVAQVSPAPPGGFPRVGRLTASLPNNHLQYAVTWFGLAAVLVVVFAVWARGRRRSARAGGFHQT